MYAMERHNELGRRYERLADFTRLLAEARNLWSSKIARAKHVADGLKLPFSVVRDLMGV